jgi:Zn-dependent protease
MKEDDISNNNDLEETLSEDQAYQDILAEIKQQQSRKKSWVTNIIILAVSLLIFFQLGLFEAGLHSVVMLIGVLLIHETGHLLGMRLFGYKNVQMFFIPLFGAAVSGESRDVAAYKRAIVSLLGPSPGIIIGCVLMLMFGATGREDYLNTAAMFLFINCFNLLPFYPLDGGRFLYQVIFSRNRYLELCFRIVRP